MQTKFWKTIRVIFPFTFTVKDDSVSNMEIRKDEKIKYVLDLFFKDSSLLLGINLRILCELHCSS